LLLKSGVVTEETKTAGASVMEAMLLHVQQSAPRNEFITSTEQFGNKKCWAGDPDVASNEQRRLDLVQ
jgi:hypothetical protein